MGTPGLRVSPRSHRPICFCDLRICGNSARWSVSTMTPGVQVLQTDGRGRQSPHRQPSTGKGPDMSATTTNDRLQRWVDDWASVLRPDSVYWCDGSAEEYDRLAGELVASGTFTQLDEAKRPNSYWAHSDPGDVARVEDRTFICSATRRAGRAQQQLARPGRDAHRDARPLRRCDAGSHAVRRPVLDGSARIADRPHRRAAHRLGLRGGVDADHDPHGSGAHSTCSATASGCHACIRSARRSSRARSTCRGPATPTTSTSCTSPRPARSGRTARATAATRCSARSASPSASRR